jgi:hypothetical protein
MGPCQVPFRNYNMSHKISKYEADICTKKDMQAPKIYISYSSISTTLLRMLAID